VVPTVRRSGKVKAVEMGFRKEREEVAVPKGV
jgi:hypothetical protein